ncbi:hypothetical protein GF326_12750 [Candidatus Bathyarchaeota archaeon]|nr:hypothetical protein [Candidatus Bathyarchaeota archaeon]
MELCHDSKYFTETSIKERSTKYGFPNNLPIELFLWDCEIAAQLQNHSKDLVLKGGAAVQLHLPVEMQRGSIDIDMITKLNESEIEKILQKVNSKLPEFTFKKHTPREPILNIPLVTYFGSRQSLILDRLNDISIKAEFLMEDVAIEHLVKPEATTFALDTKNIRCYSVPSLIGDKLLTLAGATIGVQKQEDVPKQIYDVSALCEVNYLSAHDFKQIFKTISTLIPIEANYRNLDLTIEGALKDIQTSLEKRCLLGTTGVDKDIWKNISSFQQFYVNFSQRKNQDEWSEKAWRLDYLSQLVFSILKGESTQKQAEKHNSAIYTSNKLAEIKGTKIKKLRTELLKHAPPDTPYYKELKGKSLRRIYWQMITSDNIEKVNDSLSLH